MQFFPAGFHASGFESSLPSPEHAGSETSTRGDFMEYESIRVFRPEQLDSATAQTPGSQRFAAINSSAILDKALAVHDNRIEVLRYYDATLRLRCHAGELRQVMVNLIGNAIDAMPLGGRLQLRVRKVTDGKAARTGVCITIADNGRGMSSGTLRHAFEPFYTTKDRTGTGLGLWICADIVSRHRGRIATRSNDSPGHSGSVFRVFLPR
jgi:signal transduction histidine kinase